MNFLKENDCIHADGYECKLRKELCIMEKLGKVKKGVEAMISRVAESLRVRCQVCGAVMEMEGVDLPT